MKKTSSMIAVLAGALSMAFGGVATANDKNLCKNLPRHAKLPTALKNSLPAGAGGTGDVATNGGLDLPMWATIVDEHGRVCQVTFSGATNRDQWQASRVISAQKAYTANSLTVTAAPGVFSTALLFYPTQPGQFLWGLHQSNPVNPERVYKGPAHKWGFRNDPMVGKILGGVNTFGGGLSLWDTYGNVIGGVGVSGDTSCADHNIALRVRDRLVAMKIGLGNNPADAGKYADNIIYDILNGVSASGFGHPACAGGAEEAANTRITGIGHPEHDAFPIGAAEPPTVPSTVTQ